MLIVSDKQAPTILLNHMNLSAHYATTYKQFSWMISWISFSCYQNIWKMVISKSLRKPAA